MKWLHLIWIIPLATLYLIPILVFANVKRTWAKTRRLNWELYGDKSGRDEKYHPWLGNIINQEVLCPVCERFILTSCWKEHLRYNHNDHTSWNRLDEVLANGRKRLLDETTPPVIQR